MTAIEQILRQRIGLDPVSIGTGTIHRTIRLRMKALGVASPADYAKRLQQSPTEWAELMESVVVTETWFFRDRDPFDAFVQFVNERLTGADCNQRVRILSVPCSSGEEAYSLVMSLLDAGIADERFEVDAADISPRALLKAKRATYSRNSFRGKELGFRDRYFHHSKEGYVLNPAVRSAVRFFEANILNGDFLAAHGPYDVIFCRNLLIYFDRPTQARALSSVSRLLSPDGLLVVGAAEQPLAFENGFCSANIPLAFACRKTGGPAHGAIREIHPVRRFTLPSVPRLPAATSRAGSGPGHGLTGDRTIGLPSGAKAISAVNLKPIVRPGTSPSPDAVPNLMNAQQLADEGKFGEAAELCERYLRYDATSAQGWYLLGLIRDATADPMAIECYRKALYLNPSHHESLLQMALHSEKSGDFVRARTLRRRASRAKPAINPEAAGA